MKGVIVLSSTGYLQARTYTSYAQLPLEDVAITITARDGTALAMGLTDRSGQMGPVEIPVPDPEESQSPNPEELPFALVNLYAGIAGFQQVEIENLQIFPGITTNQRIEMIPLAEFPADWGQSELFVIPPQNL